MNSSREASNDKAAPSRRDRIHTIVRLPMIGRIYAMGSAAILIAITLPPERQDLMVIVLAVGFGYPPMVYLLARFSGFSRAIGYAAFSIDGALVGAAMALLGFAFVPSTVLFTMLVAAGLVMGGFGLLLRCVLPAIIVSALAWPYVDVTFDAHGQDLPLYLGGAIISVFLVYISYLAHHTSRQLIGAKRSLESRNDQVRYQATLMASMNRVARIVNSTLDLGKVVAAITHSLSDVIEFDQVGLLFIDRENDCLTIDRYIGTKDEALGERLSALRLPLKETGSVFVLTAINNKPYFIEDTEANKLRMSPSDARVHALSPSKSLMTFPLSIHDQVIGVLVFANTRRHVKAGREEINVIGRHVEFIATAIRNARMYEQIKAAQREADAANETKSQFLANMSHELRTPMNAVIGYSEMLKEEAEDQGAEDFIPDLDRICRASKHLLRLINDVLDLSKVEADKIELYPEHIDVDDFIEEVTNGVGPILEANGNTLHVETRGDMDEIVNDETRLRQVVLNLLSNAAKFTHDGTIRMNLSRYLDEGRWWLDIVINDNGIGMSPEQIEKVFDPFTQADASTTRKYGGTGLGLAITKRYCELMGGTILVESEEDRGSTFTVRIPANLDDPEPDATATQTVETDFLDGTNETGATILVIDDDATALDLMQRLLAREGYRVLTAEDGKSGLELARKRRPDVITLDALMPGMDGWTVLGELKANPELNGIPVVMISFVDEPNKGLALGASDYLTKPVERSHLLNILGRIGQPDDREVLVIEDDEDTRDLICRWLEQEGWKVRQAADGREGLAAFRALRPTVVVLDLMMPDIDGFEFLATLRSEFPDDRSRVIVVTAKELVPDDLKRLNGSVERIIHKVRAPDEQLLEEISRHLSVDRVPD
jgi:signal transduction histidine kinase/CheY-like chemotaxis protein